MLPKYIRIEKVKIKVLLIAVLIFAGACSSSKPAASHSESVSKKKVDISKLPTRMKSRVEMKNADGSVTPVNLPGSHSRTYIDPETGKKYQSPGWVDPTRKTLAGKHLRKFSSEELGNRAAKVSAREATLIIEELRSRREKGIVGLVKLLNDDRKAVFERGKEYWWYEKKDEPAEAIELRVYAAYALQFTLRTYPSGVYMDMTTERMLYAVKDKFAVVKDDVIKVWTNWWSKAKNDY